MLIAPLAKQFLLDATGKPIAVLLPIEEYEALVEAQPNKQEAGAPRSLYGALSHLEGTVAPTEELDETLRELWSAWDREPPA